MMRKAYSTIFRKKAAAVRATFAVALTMLLCVSCIKNDIPYPRIQPDILEIEAEGMLKPAQIDVTNRFVVMTFDETVDMQNVKITHYQLSEGARVVRGSLEEPMNLEEYYILTLALYQDYDWVIEGVQNIERYFTVDGQMGATIIDVAARRVVVTLPESVGLEHVKVLTMKLGPEGCLTTPSLAGEEISLEQPKEVELSIHGRKETWTIYGRTVTSTVETTRADAWSQVAWVYGSAIEGRDNGVEYRLKGTEEWTKAPAAWVQHTGATFCARLTGLNPLTTYEARAYSNDETGVTVEFSTGSIPQLPNESFDEWSQSGKVWNPWGADQTPYWDTGNKGATTLGDSNTYPTDDTSTGTGRAACLETRFVGIGVIGKLAAGNIFAGRYVKTDGTNGILSFGRPFTERPTRLQGYLKYTSVPISHTTKEFENLKGEPDACIVWVALIDSAEPFEIRTNPSNRQLFDPDGPEVVAYGSFESDQTIPNYIQFNIDLEYKATNRVPTYILVVASASKYGDYFTGGNGSVLCIDDLQLLYDY